MFLHIKFLDFSIGSFPLTNLLARVDSPPSNLTALLQGPNHSHNHYAHNYDDENDYVFKTCDDDDDDARGVGGF